MKALTIIALLVVLPSCVEREPGTTVTRYYTRSEIDAINAEIACRNLARNVLQMERCVVRR